MEMMALVRNWWMVAIRGGLAMLFGASILLWPNSTLFSVVLLFGVYAVLDGLWAMSSACRASKHLLDAWPVALEGVVSLALGLLSLVWPFISRELIYFIAGWASPPAFSRSSQLGICRATPPATGCWKPVARVHCSWPSWF